MTFTLFVVFFHHLNNDGQRNDKGSINTLSNIDRVTIAEEGEFAANLGDQVAIVIAHTEIPIPNIAVDMENYAIAALNFKAFAKKRELFVHSGPKLTIAVNLVVRHERKNLLPNLH